MAGRLALDRLRRRADFLKVAEGRRRMAAPGLVLQVRRRPEAGTSAEADKVTRGGIKRAAVDPAAVRVGFTASRKVGGAVERNRARRRLKAAVAQILPERAEPGHDYVLIARSATLTRPFALLLADLERALARLSAPRASASRASPPRASASPGNAGRPGSDRESGA